jgi:type IV secretion system protein VirB10
LILGIAAIGILGVVTFLGVNGGRQKPAPQQAVPAQAVAQAPAVQPVEQAPPVPLEAITPPPAPLPIPAPAPVGLAGPAANPYSTPTVLFDASALPPSVLPGVSPAAASPGGPNDEFAARVGGVGGGSAIAAAGINPKATVTQGTLIPAVLETAIDTDVPGYLRAIVSSDVRSFDGTVVLIPHSSRLIGQYKSGMQAGQKRAYVIWTRLIRPDGVSVNIASPAVGFGGETGLPGKVDNHFFERFGSAMLLSVIGGISSSGSNNATVLIGSQAQSAAAAAVGQSGQIGPTIRVRQGEPIRVFTARDLDFSKVTTE